MYLPEYHSRVSPDVLGGKHRSNIRSGFLSKSCENITQSEMKQSMESTNPFPIISQSNDDVRLKAGCNGSNQKKKKFTFQSTVRLLENRRLAEKLSREAELKGKSSLNNQLALLCQRVSKWPKVTKPWVCVVRFRKPKTQRIGSDEESRRRISKEASKRKSQHQTPAEAIQSRRKKLFFSAGRRLGGKSFERRPGSDLVTRTRGSDATSNSRHEKVFHGQQENIHFLGL